MCVYLSVCGYLWMYVCIWSVNVHVCEWTLRGGNMQQYGKRLQWCDIPGIQMLHLQIFLTDWHEITFIDLYNYHLQVRVLTWYHDDVIKWKHFPCNWPFVRGIHRWAVNSPHKGQWRGALMFTSICARINGWINNREAGDLRRHLAHSDVIVMISGTIERC